MREVGKGMKVRFLGTAAFEGIPSMFCRCELCLKAKELGGKDIRTRTSAMIDDELKIDFPPDTYLHMLRDGLDLEKIQDLVLTHSHSDHLYAEDLFARFPGYARSGEHTIGIYGNDLTMRKCRQVLGDGNNKYSLHRVVPFRRTQTRTASIVPLPANHDPLETCLIYYIEKDGKTLLYGHDSGWFPEETWEWLSDKKLDLAVLECTAGRLDTRTHMNIDSTVRTKERFVERGMLNPSGQVVVTHFSHNAHLLHQDLAEIFAPHEIIVAYDGMVLEI